jgi:D-alanyl-D-alanine carboxypeptidase
MPIIRKGRGAGSWMIAAGLGLLVLGGCGSSDPVWFESKADGGATSAYPTEPTDGSHSDDQTFTIGAAAVDSVYGWLPDGATLTPFDVSNPVVGWLDPQLLGAIQNAARRAASDGIHMEITSGWRSKGFQQRLFDDAVRKYGSVDDARQYVASPDVSQHVVGKAVDIGPFDAAEWLIRNGAQFGLCQIYANENWHFERAADERGACPPLKANAAG